MARSESGATKQSLLALPEPAASLWALYRAITPALQKRLLWLLPAMLVGAVAELVTIGSVLPVLALLADFDRTLLPGGLRVFSELLGDEEPPVLIRRAVGLLIAAAVLSGAVRLAILWKIQRVVQTLGHEISTQIFSSVLGQPYVRHLKGDPSQFLSSIEKVQVVVHSAVLPMMQGLLAAIIAVFVLAVMIATEPLFGLAIIGALVAAYLLISVVAASRLRTNSSAISELMSMRIRALRDGLGNIRDIKLERNQAVFEAQYRKMDLRYRRAQGGNLFISSAPRFIIETIGIVAISLLALQLSQSEAALSTALPTIGILALGSQRLMPLLQTVYAGGAIATAAARTVWNIVELLELPPGDSPAPANRPVRVLNGDIVLEGVAFHHGDDLPVLSNIDLKIEKGARIGLVGASGSGKSTLLDLIMALLEPTAGQISVDGQPLDASNRADWQAQIAHVPQSIYLANETVAANIAFGVQADAIDMTRVRKVAKLAKASGFIARMPLGYQTLVGPGGSRLSGGQRQRIAIARALYRRARVLILDEATGQLDLATERSILAAVGALPREVTIIVVAHRESALANCDVIIELARGRIQARRVRRPVQQP